jgi:hypothetical protein
MKEKTIFGIMALLAVTLVPTAVAASSPAWVLVDTLTVPAQNIPVITSTETLLDGWLYRFEVSGTYSAGGSYEADAEYTTLDGWASHSDGALGDPDLLDLKVDGSFVNWGSYSSSHVYKMDHIGTGSTVSFQIYDIDGGTNNTGELTVKILATPVMVSTAIISGPESVEVGEPNCWEIEITVQAKYADVNDVVVQDGMGADLDVNEVNAEPVVPQLVRKKDTWTDSTGDITLTKKGKMKDVTKKGGTMGATMVTWDVGDLTAGGSDTLVVRVCTGLNPNDKQEFTSAEENHELDGGASATYLYGDPELEYESPETIPVTVDVVEP